MELGRSLSYKVHFCLFALWVQWNCWRYGYSLVFYIFLFLKIASWIDCGHFNSIHSQVRLQFFWHGHNYRYSRFFFCQRRQLLLYSLSFCLHRSGLCCEGHSWLTLRRLNRNIFWLITWFDWRILEGFSEWWSNIRHWLLTCLFWRITLSQGFLWNVLCWSKIIDPGRLR